MTQRFLLPLFTLILACVACEKNEAPQGAPPAPAETKPVADTPAGAAAAAAPVAAAAPSGGAAEQAKVLFAQRCTLCHGTDGRGTGPAAANLNPKPRDYTDAAWQAATSDEDVRKIIVEGGAAVGKSMMMPPNPDLKDKPDVVSELVQVVRRFKK